MPSVRVSVVIVQDGHVLLMRHRRRGRTYWVIPGGKVEEFEALDVSAIREIREETGLEIRLGPLVAVFEINDRWTRHVVNLVFLADGFTGALALPAGGPLSETLDRADFVDADGLAALSFHPRELQPLLAHLAVGVRPVPRYLGDLTAAVAEDEA